MADNSKIEWTDATWNPIRARRMIVEIPDHPAAAIAEDIIPGARASVIEAKIGWHCEHVSEGCRLCYAESMNRRLGTGLDYKPGHRDDIEIFLDEKMLRAPLHWKRPRKIFIGSMTDLFADFVTDTWLDRIFAVMALSPQHTFQLLTKRPARMREYLAHCGAILGRQQELRNEIEKITDSNRMTVAAARLRVSGSAERGSWKPLPNVWLGVSCEDQPTADARIPDLLATPAAIRFLSLEPLLGPIDLTLRTRDIATDTLRGTRSLHNGEPLTYVWGKIDWVIVGGESGPQARPIHPDWARSLRDQCAATGVPFFFKQWGEYGPTQRLGDKRSCAIDIDGKLPPGDPSTDEGCDEILQMVVTGSYQFMSHYGKKAAGRLLDGRTHDEFPDSIP